MQLKNGKFTVEVDIQDFDLEDIDIKVEGASLILTGKREGRGGNLRQFAQRIPLPASINVSQLGTELTSEGRLLISAPQKEEDTVAASAAAREKPPQVAPQVAPQVGPPTRKPNNDAVAKRSRR